MSRSLKDEGSVSHHSDMSGGVEGGRCWSWPEEEV